MKNQTSLKAVGKQTKKTRLQQQYDKLVEGINFQKQQQTNIQEGMRKVMPKIEAEIRPLLDRKNELDRELLLRLDEVAKEIGVGKFNKEWFEGYMLTWASDILATNGTQDAEVKVLFEKYSGESYRPDEDEIGQMKAMFQDEFGLEIDIDEILEKGFGNYMHENGEDFMKQILERKAEMEAEELGNFDANAAIKKSKKESSLEKDARSIYLRLIKKYHPDRVTTDESKKQLYHDITQAVTNAYQANNFLELLKLQIEYLEENEDDAVLLAEDTLKQYNRLLKQQLQELAAETEMMKMSTNGLYEDFFDKNSKFSTRRFNTYLKNLTIEIKEIEADLKASHKRKKGWFADWIRRIKEETQQQMFANIFSEMFR